MLFGIPPAGFFLIIIVAVLLLLLFVKMAAMGVEGEDESNGKIRVKMVVEGRGLPRVLIVVDLKPNP